MKFKWILREGTFGSDCAIRIFSVNDHLQGLQIQNEKPNTVELDYKEVNFLLQNKEQLITVLLCLKQKK